ncbi:MAG: hypothetical protein IJ803_06150 [Oribacterium sp.]|nr:hypothetical protein [Oribacterium sp.]
MKEDPYFKDLGDGRYAIQFHWRGVQIKYPPGIVSGGYFIVSAARR